MGAVNTQWPIVILDDWDNICETSQAVQRLKQRFPVAVHSTRLEPDELAKALANAAIVIPFRERSKIDAPILEQAVNLRLIAQTGGGAAHVDRAFAAQRGVTISITPGGSAQSVAELVLGLALAFEHRIVEGDRLIRGGEWRSLLGRDIGGKTLGLLGFGATAQAVAPRAKALGMDVLAWSRSLAERGASEAVTVAGSLDDLLAKSDIVSIHLPLNDATRGFMNRERLAMMKPASVLINTARGAIVDTDALIAALDQGHVRGACLDVFDPEPLPVDHPLRARPDVIVTPHVGWTTIDTMHRFLEVCEANIDAFLAGEPRNVLQPA